jgi:putative membrane-bound dehydrogenase-like protein
MRPLALLPLLLLTTVVLAENPDGLVPPDKSVELMKVPDGFHVTLFAGEPDVVKPIATTTDDRGRLWVVESHSYPNWITDGSEGHDRVLIFEDLAAKGHFDTCTVFWDKGTNLSGIAVGFGGVWLCATPNLLFIPVRPGEDKPAGPPEVVLDGWDLKAKHNVFNSLTWGPDGWLYGCNGILSNSVIGKPGTPASERVAFDCGVWRYHPTKKVFEAFAWGTTNPWGLDFDDRGEMFITNCVIKHLFHVIQGAHFQRMYGQDLNPYSYGLMESCADHFHWAGGDWTTSRGGLGAHGESGGGHAHVGAMVYLGDNWPDAYHDHVFMCNLHGSRLNQDVLERHGSGYVAHHGADFLMANDPWFRGVTLLYGPDGGVFVSDWHDTGECHNYDQVHPNGRIFKVTYGNPALVKADLAGLGDEELVRLQSHKNDWWVRHARRLLQERAAAGKLADTVRSQLLKMLSEQSNVPRRLRALWALHSIGALDEKTLLGLLDDSEETLRGWSVRLLLEDRKSSEIVIAKLANMAEREKSAAVRLALASALQRLPIAERWSIAQALARRVEDSNDPNLPLMVWYGMEPLAPADPERAVRLLAGARLPLVRQFLARRVTSLDAPGPLVGLLTEADDPALEQDILRGMFEAFQGRRGLSPPHGWATVQRKFADSSDPEIREKTVLLSVLFGDPEAIAALRKTVADATTEDAARRHALQTLVEAKAPDMLPLLHQLVTDHVLCGPALRALASYRDPDTPALLLRHYDSFSDAEKADAIATLASRPEYALPLLDAMERGQVPRKDLSPFIVRQLLNLNNKGLTEKLTKVWGTIRPPSQEKANLLARYMSLTPPDALRKADRSQGRQTFVRVCATCHTLFTEGGKIGPDLTGSQRVKPEYVLSKVLDPSAVVSKDYQVTIFRLADGRTVSGIIKEETDKTVTVQTQNDVLRLTKTDIEEREKSSQSMMPEGLLAPMSDAEVRDLMAYLAGPDQVPLPTPARPGSNP